MDAVGGREGGREGGRDNFKQLEYRRPQISSTNCDFLSRMYNSKVRYTSIYTKYVHAQNFTQAQ